VGSLLVKVQAVVKGCGGKIPVPVTVPALVLKAVKTLYIDAFPNSRDFLKLIGNITLRLM
jgi:hypothetical protein